MRALRHIGLALGAALFIACAAPVHATQDGWPALHDVAGVAADDVLNIRAAPSASAAIVGELAPEATDVEVIEANDLQTWGRVNTSEGSGWVSLAFLARHPGQWEGAFPRIRACYGTEPFWDLGVDGGSVAFRRADGADISLTERWRIGSVGRRDRFALGAETVDATMTAVLLKAECSDGMSDRIYGIAIEAVLIDGSAQTLWSGCCSLNP